MKHFILFLFLFGSLMSSVATIQAKPDETSVPAHTVPTWAPFSNVKDYGRFRTEIQKYFQKRGEKVEISRGVVHTLNEKGERVKSYGLSNIAQICRDKSPGEYAATIESFYGNLDQNRRFLEEFDKRADDFEAVRKYLGVRIYTGEYLGDIHEKDFGGDLICKELSEDLYLVLVFDLPYGIANVSSGMPKIWKKSLKELFAIGQENIETRYPVAMHRQELGNFAVLNAFTEHFYAGNALLRLPLENQWRGKYGTLVGIPTRHDVLLYPVEDKNVLLALEPLLELNWRLYKKGPGALTGDLYWYYKGNYLPVRVNQKEGKLAFEAPKEFHDVIAALVQN